MVFEMVDTIVLSGVLGKINFSHLHKDALHKQSLLHQKMIAVAEMSKLPGSPLILQVQKKSKGVWSLRWRHKVGRIYIYLNWENAQKNVLTSMNLEVQTHYEYLNNFAKELNTLDCIIYKIITDSKTPYSI